MRIGVVFPQTELGGDRGAVRAYGEAVAGLGYTHLLAYDHVLGADPTVHQGWAGPYDVDTTFHEPFVLFGYLAALVDARAGHRHHHPPAAPDRAGGQAGRRGRSAHRGPVPPRCRPRLEPRRVRGAGPVLHHPRAAAVRADRGAAPAVDRADGGCDRRRRGDHRRRSAPEPDPAPDPGVGRRLVGAGLPAHRAAGRRLVPAGPPGRRPRPRAGDASRRPPTGRAATRRPSAWRAA